MRWSYIRPTAHRESGCLGEEARFDFSQSRTCRAWFCLLLAGPGHHLAEEGKEVHILVFHK